MGLVTVAGLLRTASSDRKEISLNACLARYAVASLIVLLFVGAVFLFGCAVSGAAEESPISIYSLMHQASVAFQAGRFSEAGELFLQQAQSHDREEHKAWFNAGASFWNAGRKKEALQYYEKAVDVNPLYFLGHKRLAVRYESNEQMKLAEQHRDHALAIRKVEKAMTPLREKAHTIRTKGGDWYHATALVHENSAQAYESLGHPEFAKAERHLAEQSRAELAVETARLQKMQQQPQLDAQERASNAKVLNALVDMNAHINSANPAVPPSSSQAALGQGFGMLQQAYSGYSQIAGAYDRQLQSQREAIHQQGQQAQAALADPKQSKLQGDAQQRTRALQERLEALEQQASAYLADKGLLDEKDLRESDLDVLDL